MVLGEGGLGAEEGVGKGRGCGLVSCLGSEVGWVGGGHHQNGGPCKYLHLHCGHFGLKIILIKKR